MFVLILSIHLYPSPLACVAPAPKGGAFLYVLLDTGSRYGRLYNGQGFAPNHQPSLGPKTMAGARLSATWVGPLITPHQPGGYSAWLLTKSIRLASRWAEVLGRGARRRVVGCCDFDDLV